MALKSLCELLKGFRGSHKPQSGAQSGEVDQIESMIQNIMRLHASLVKAPDLRPCGHINSLFGELVCICSQTLNHADLSRVLGDARITHLLSSLRNLAAVAESHLEAHWAEHVIAAADEIQGHKHLKEFPYYENYVDLTRMELGAINSVTPSLPQRVAFIGSGPLPLTSLCMYEALECSKKNKDSDITSSETLIINIDNNANAVSQSTTLCKKLGERAQGLHFICQDAESLELELSNCDVVYLAALVGATQRDKEIVLTNVVERMQEGSLLVVRTAHSLRTLLYPEFDATTDAVLACLEICLVVHPYNHVVNSVIIGRVKPREKGDTR